MKASMIILSNQHIPVQGGRWLETLPAVQGPRQGPTLDMKLLHHRVNSHPPTLTQTGTCGHTNSPNVHIFGIWEETGVPWEPMQTWGDCANST